VWADGIEVEATESGVLLGCMAGAVRRIGALANTTESNQRRRAGRAGRGRRRVPEWRVSLRCIGETRHQGNRLSVPYGPSGKPNVDPIRQCLERSDARFTRSTGTSRCALPRVPPSTGPPRPGRAPSHRGPRPAPVPGVHPPVPAALLVQRRPDLVGPLHRRPGPLAVALAMELGVQLRPQLLRGGGVEGGRGRGRGTRGGP